jgi:hypothetical protein
VFDFPAWLEAIVGIAPPVIVKLDCEGAEYPILRKVHDRGIDLHLAGILVEWHDGIDPDGDFYGHGWNEMGRPELRCAVEAW